MWTLPARAPTCTPPPHLALMVLQACDDGGLHAQYTDCPYGTDCDDCAERPKTLCSDTCYYAHDGTCARALRRSLSKNAARIWMRCRVPMIL